MASQTDVVNRALLHCVDQVITDINDNTNDAARKMKAAWPLARDYVLARHPWNCAMTRKSIASAAAAPAFEWSYAYVVPQTPKCLRVWRIGASPLNRGDETNLFVVEAGHILCNLPAPLSVRYIARITDTEQYSPALVEALALYLAATVGPSIGNSAARGKLLMDAFEHMVSDAQGQDAQEGTPEAWFGDDFLEARQ